LDLVVTELRTQCHESGRVERLHRPPPALARIGGEDDGEPVADLHHDRHVRVGGHHHVIGHRRGRGGGVRRGTAAPARSYDDRDDEPDTTEPDAPDGSERSAPAEEASGASGAFVRR